MGGSLAVNKKVFKYVEQANKITGLRLGPDDAYLIIRGLRTLDIRLDKHQENAKKIAKFLSKNKNSIDRFVNSLKLFGYGYSWGGFESLALHQEIRKQGKRKYLNLLKDEHIVRLHIGLEDPKDLINDLKRSLRFIK